MLYLDSPVGSIAGLTLFRDHANPNLFYYACERPRLAMNEGVPEFVFLVYQRDITDNPNLTPEAKQQLGGGFLAFTVDLSVDDVQLKEVRRRLGQFADGTVELAPLPYRSGTVRLSITKDTAEAPGAAADTPKGVSFFEEVYGTSKPSLLGGNRATFGVMMDHEGALLMEAALKSGISPIGVIYDLEYLGMRPAFNVKITADYKRIYNHLEMQFGIRGGVGPITAAVDIGMAWQKLREDGSIKVEVTNFTDDENFRKQADAAFDWFKTELLRDFFKSSLEPPSFMKQGQSSNMLGALQSLLGPLTESQQGPTRPAMGAPTTLAPTPSAPPTSLDSGTQTTADRNKSATAAAAPQDSAAKPAANGTQFGLQIGFSLKMYQQEELKTRSFEYSMQAAVSRTAAPQGLFSTIVNGMDLSHAIKHVSLDDDFFKHVNAKFQLGADLAASQIELVSINIEYPGVRPDGVQPEQVGGITFTPQDNGAKLFRTFLNDALDLRYRYKMDIHFAQNSDWEGNEPHYTSGWIVETGQAPQVNPFDAVDQLQIEVSLGSTVIAPVQQVQIDLVYDDPAVGMRAERSMTFKPGDPTKNWKLRFPEGAIHSFKHRVTYFLDENVRHRTDWIESGAITTEAMSLIIPGPFLNTMKIPVLSLLDPSSIIEASVDVLYVDAARGYEWRGRTVFGPDSQNQSRSREISIPTLDPIPHGVTYSVTVVRADGTVLEVPSREIRPGEKIMVSDGVGQTRIIRIELANTNLEAAGLVAVRVRVRGQGEDADHDDVIFRPGDVSPKSVMLVQPIEGAFTYSYEVEGYTAFGVPKAGVRTDTQDLKLVVGLP
ncbi:hypothetical protein [Rhizobium sp. Root483D2]|uniref:hypothetical protein n=1 Tax=Rhizobium sp. Root483D2 TaxID=1736545 RepID=UPI000715EE45|nr:hypothetical protein [Rhizobium sp. Root483D2]KQY42492.1 hypothetical protein ASD32_14105 [Rhizobium sp. Root483D2]